MAKISAKEVNELRKATGVGIMDCKEALTETNGDMEAAIEFLRKKGQKVAAKRADREAKEGVVIARTNNDGNKGYVLHLSSETDFVAKNEDFINFAQSIVDLAIDQDIQSLDDLLAQQMNGTTVADKINEKVGAIGENIKIVNYDRIEGETVVPYIHMGYKVGVLVGLNKSANDTVSEIGKDVAMQVAAMNPIAINESGVPEDVKTKELEIGRELALNEGKPEKIIDNIAQGRLKKFYKENTLLNQQFVKDSSKTVAKALQEVDGDLTVTTFKRVALG